MNKDVSSEETQRLREFLLGLDAPAGGEPADSELEDRMFADEELSLRLQEEQSAVIEDFVRGRLSGEERRRFQQQYSRSASLRAQVADFRALRSALERRQQPAAAADRLRWRPSRLALAAVGFACVALMVLVVHRSWHSHDAPAAQAPVASAPPLNNVVPRTPTLAVATFFLGDNVTRGAAETPVLKLPPDTSEVALQIELRGEHRQPGAWDVAVTAGSRDVWRAEAVHPKVVGQEAFLPVSLPASALPDGSYSIRLSPAGRSSSSVTPTLSVRSFIVSRAERK